MIEHRGQTFRGLSDSGSERTFLEGHRFISCEFDNCRIDAPPSPSSRSTLRNVILQNCKQRACGVAGAILEGVQIDGLARLGRIPLWFSGAVFRRSILSGKIGLFKIHPAPSVTPSTAELRSWLDANRSFYEETDWALDISKAKFSFGPDLHFVPGHLVRIDPAHQAIVTREELQTVNLAHFDVAGSALHVALAWFLEDGPYQSTAISAGGSADQFQADVAFIQKLRKAGLGRTGT